jgi:hypothetical protein
MALPRGIEPLFQPCEGPFRKPTRTEILSKPFISAIFRTTRNYGNPGESPLSFIDL